MVALSATTSVASAVGESSTSLPSNLPAASPAAGEEAKGPPPASFYFRKEFSSNARIENDVAGSPALQHPSAGPQTSPQDSCCPSSSITSLEAVSAGDTISAACQHPQLEQKRLLLRDLTCTSSSPRQRIERNLSLKRSSWRNSVRSLACGDQMETLQLLKEVAHQARLLLPSSSDQKDDSADDCEWRNMTAPSQEQQRQQYRPSANDRDVITNSKAMLSLSQHRGIRIRSSRPRPWRQDLRQEEVDYQKVHPTQPSYRVQDATAATKIQAGYRMYRCRLVYLRDLLPLSITRRSLKKSQGDKKEPNKTRCTVEDGADPDASKHTLENVSCHLLLQKTSRHSLAVSDLEDSFASLDEIRLSPRTNMERYNNQSLSSSLKLWASSSLSREGGLSLQTPASLRSTAISDAAKTLNSTREALGTVKSLANATTTTASMLTTSFMAATPPMTPTQSPWLMESSCTSLPVLRTQPAMVSSYSPFASSNLFLRTNNASNEAAPPSRDGITSSTASNPSWNVGHRSHSSFFINEDDYLKTRPPLERFDASKAFCRRRNTSVDDVLQFHANLSTVPSALVVSPVMAAATGGRDSPVKRPNRLPSAHVRRSDIETDEDEEDGFDESSDGVSLGDILSFEEEDNSSHEYTTTTKPTSMPWDDAVPNLPHHQPEQERGRRSPVHSSSNASPTLHASIASSRWSEEPVDMIAFGNMSCMTYFESMGTAKLPPDTPVRRPTRKLSPHCSPQRSIEDKNKNLMHDSCPALAVRLSSLSPPSPKKATSFIQRPGPEVDNFEEAVSSPRAPTRRFSRHFLLQQFQEDLPRLSNDNESTSCGKFNKMMTSKDSHTAAKAREKLSHQIEAPLPPPPNVGFHAPTRRLSTSGHGDDVSASSSLSTGPSLHRRLEQSPYWPTRKQTVSESPSWVSSPRKQAVEFSTPPPPPPPPPPPSTSPPLGQGTPPMSTYSVDTLITMPTRKQSIETILSSRSAGTVSGTLTSSSKSSSITRQPMEQQGCSPKSVMDLVDVTTVTSSSSSSFAASTTMNMPRDARGAVVIATATPAPSLLLAGTMSRYDSGAGRK